MGLLQARERIVRPETDTAAAPILVRPSHASDVARLAAIYRHHVLHGLASFEEMPPDADELARRRDAVLARGLPHLVACDGDAVLGYAYAGPYRTRSAYRFTVEDSVYIAPEAIRRGVGRALLAAVVEARAPGGCRPMIAGVGGSPHDASVRAPPAPG